MFAGLSVYKIEPASCRPIKEKAEKDVEKLSRLSMDVNLITWVVGLSEWDTEAEEVCG